MEERIHSLCVGWRNLPTLCVGWRNLFSSCAVVSILILVGRVRLNVGRLSSYHPHFWILVCKYFRIFFYLFLSTWVSRGSAFFRLRVFFIACVYFRSLNSYYLTFLLPIAEFIRECPLTYCRCHSDLPASSVFCGKCFFSSASLAPDGSF